ncbi:ATP-grasp domain-containing protein, partial [bacterium]|nr:ATP-grasp domain-containing protein [bacterium]
QNYNMLTTIIKQEEHTKKIMNTKKLRVAVLLGGNSNEKEISLESGRNIVYKLSPQKYDALPVFVSKNMELFRIEQKQLVLNSTAELEKTVTPESKIKWNDLPKIADFVFIALHGGLGENGSVQGTLEMLGVPYNGSSVLASALCADKHKTNSYLEKKGFVVPQSLLLCKKEWNKNKNLLLERIYKTIESPLIIKPHDDGCSMLVQKLTFSKNNLEPIEHALDNFFNNSEKNYALIEQCIKGMELTVGVFGNETVQALPPSQSIVTKDILSLEEKFLPGAGENQTPAPLSNKILQYIQKTIENVYKELDCSGYARIDCFYIPKNNFIVILEINTLPGMTPATCIFHQAAEIGIRPMEFVDQIVQLGLEKHTFKQPLTSLKSKDRTPL